MSYLNETRYRWFSVDFETDLSAEDLELSLDQTTWVTATHTTEPAGADFPAPAPGFTRFWWKLLIGPDGGSLMLTETDQTIYGRIVLAVETIRPTWIVQSLAPPTPNPGTGVCLWPIELDDCACTQEVDDDSLFESIVAQASSMLTRLSGFTVGQCQYTIRPLKVCRECRSWCCGGTDGIPLSGNQGLPVADVVSVKIGSTVIPKSGWYFDRELQTLWRVPPDTWPKRDERWQAPGTGEAFCVEVITGNDPDEWALRTAASLVCELLKSCAGDAKCRLPRNAVSVTSAGVTIQLRDKDINNLLPEVTAWVAAVNPHGAKLPAKVYSPDLAKSVRGGLCCGR